jgi:hypothetical protein
MNHYTFRIPFSTLSRKREREREGERERERVRVRERKRVVVSVLQNKKHENFLCLLIFVSTQFFDDNY